MAQRNGITRALATALVIIGFGVFAAVATAAPTRTYSLSGSATMSPGTGTCLDCLPPSSTASGSASCSFCLPPSPIFGSFSLDLPRITTFPPNPCKVKAVSGTLSVSWDNSLVSSAPVSGRYIDGKPVLTLAGTFPANDPQYPTDPLKIVLNNFPPSPCTSATNSVTGTLAISG